MNRGRGEPHVSSNISHEGLCDVLKIGQYGIVPKAIAVKRRAIARRKLFALHPVVLIDAVKDLRSHSTPPPSRIVRSDVVSLEAIFPDSLEQSLREQATQLRLDCPCLGYRPCISRYAVG